MRLNFRSKMEIMGPRDLLSNCLWLYYCNNWVWNNICLQDQSHWNPSNWNNKYILGISDYNIYDPCSYKYHCETFLKKIMAENTSFKERRGSSRSIWIEQKAKRTHNQDFYFRDCHYNHITDTFLQLWVYFILYQLNSYEYCWGSIFTFWVLVCLDVVKSFCYYKKHLQLYKFYKLLRSKTRKVLSFLCKLLILFQRTNHWTSF